MSEEEAYAIGYYYGRAIGNDEEGIAEMGGDYDHGALTAAFRRGYDRGVSDYADKDL